MRWFQAKRGAAVCTRRWIWIGTTFLAAACSGGDASRSIARPDGIQDLVTWGPATVLEENDDVVSVLIRVSIDPSGGFLIADEQESQIRRYGPSGNLLAHFGSKGQGPMEFSFLNRAMRLPSGEVLALDTYYRGAVFDSSGSTVVRTFRTPVGPLHAGTILNDSVALLGGQVRTGRSDDRERRLHLWNFRRDTLFSSFFAPAIEGRARKVAANTAGFVDVAVRGDTIAAIFALSDTVYLFQTNGDVVDKIPVPFRFFRHLSEDVPLPSPNAGVVKAREWIGSFSMIANVFWLPDGSFLVQYQDRNGPTPQWRLMHMGRHGQHLREVVDSPQLLAVDSSGPTLYFVDPSSLTPDRWKAARLRD